jgi:hypothetical protein
MNEPSLDRLVTAGTIQSYEYNTVKGDYGMASHESVTITFPNGEKVEFSSRGGNEEASWLVVG